MNKEITIAIINDIHHNKESVQQLKKYWNQKKITADYIISCGDFVSIKTDEQTDMTKVNPAIEECHEHIHELETLCSNVLFVPGNHDPSYLFENNLNNHISLSEHSINLHRNIHRIRENLIVVGCGGCVPKTIEGKFKKVGYPYKTDQEFQKDIETVLPSDGNVPNCSKEDNIILVTHCGPSCSHTSLEFPPGKPIHQIGSDCLSQLIESKEYNQRITCLLHGHAHDSQGFVQHYHVPIINPGAVKRNHCFCLITLRENDNEWIVVDVHFQNFLLH